MTDTETSDEEFERLRDAAAVNRTSMEVIRDAAIWLKRNKKEAPDDV